MEHLLYLKEENLTAFLDTVDFDKKDQTGDTFLIKMTKNPTLYKDIIVKCLEKPVDWNQTDGRYTFFEHLLLDWVNDYNMFKFLMDKSNNYNYKDSAGNNLINIICYRTNIKNDNKIKYISLLLKKSIDINEKNIHGYAPLHRLYHDEYPTIGKFLVNHGADVNSKMMDGNTLLHHYARGEIYIMKEKILLLNLFIEWGADTTIKNNGGETAFDIINEQPELKKLFFKDTENDKLKKEIEILKEEKENLSKKLDQIKNHLN
jgi:ankyrin repeat protein